MPRITLKLNSSEVDRMIKLPRLYMIHRTGTHSGLKPTNPRL